MRVRTSPSDLESVVSTVEEDIVFGRMGPRARLTEDEMMARFDIKRHVAREVLSRLGQTGIIEKVPNRGAAVRAFTVEEVEQIYFMRSVLQSVAAGMIPLPASPALVEKLRRLQREHSAEIERGNLRAVYYLDKDFHETLFAACGNPYLVSTIRKFAWMAHAIRSYRIADPVLLARARDEHAAMVEALEQGDRERLVTLCVEHINPSKQAYLATQAQLAPRAAPRRSVG